MSHYPSNDINPRGPLLSSLIDNYEQSETKRSEAKPLLEMNGPGTTALEQLISYKVVKIMT